MQLLLLFRYFFVTEYTISLQSFRNKRANQTPRLDKNLINTPHTVETS